MASTTHMATPEDDRRHRPGPTALPLWSESYWFPLYDPEHEIGVVLRAGMYMRRGDANLYLFVTHRGAIVHAVTEHRAPPPPLDGDSFTIAGLRVDIEQPLERFRLRYEHGATAFDLMWQAASPAYKYPTPPSDEFPGHIEQGGRVTGTVTLGGARQPFAGLGHRDHSWGGERDWTKFKRWTYLSGEFDDSWFNAVRIDLGEQLDIRIGCLWDGRELLALQQLEIAPRTVEGGSRQTGVEAHLTDEHGRSHHIVGEEIVANCPVWMGRTVLKDGITRFRSGDRIGWGIHEHGFIEQDG